MGNAQTFACDIFDTYEYGYFTLTERNSCVFRRIGLKRSKRFEGGKETKRRYKKKKNNAPCRKSIGSEIDQFQQSRVREKSLLKPI